MFDFHDPWTCGWVLGIIVGNAICYFSLFRPMMRLKDEYIARLEKRLENR